MYQGFVMTLVHAEHWGGGHQQTRNGFKAMLHFQCRTTSDRRGLTLLELMVVLVILAIVATVALQSLQPQVENQRFQSASSLLKEIEAATLGPANKYQIDGTPLISGFVADIGRPPLAESTELDTSKRVVLAELWDPESALAMSFPFQFRPGPVQPTDYSKVQLPCGWRSPYLQLPIGAKTVRDPWGRTPEITVGDRGEAQQVQISIVAAIDQDQPVVLSTDLTSGKVEVIGKLLLNNPENSTVQVVMLAPDPESSLTTLAVLDDEDEQPGSFLFSNIPIGLRAIVIDVDGKRQIKYVQVPHSGLTVCFDLQQLGPEASN